MTSRKKADYYTRLARKRDYPARSIFKLEEIDRRTGLLERGDRVLDLGASPGSWMKYISEKVGRGGSVLGIDRKPPGIELPPNARFVQADVFELTAEDILGISETGGFDVVVSDLAPRTTGVRHADQEESWRLFERAVILAGGMLEPGGRFTGKLLFSSRHGQAVDMLRSGYESVRTIHPKATRKESKEVFIVAKNRLG